MKIWCVSYYSGLGYNDSSRLFLTKEEAQNFYYNLHSSCECKMFQTTDIWHWCARHFRRVVNEIVALRDSGDNFTYIYGLVEELRETAKHCGIKEFCADLVWGDVSWEKDSDTCFLSVAWYYDNKLEHMMFKMEGIDHPFKHTPLYKRGWEKHEEE